MLSDTIFNITTFDAFEETALKVFAFQFENNPVYRSFCDLLYKHPSDVKQLEDIPFLPISFFKTHKITTETSNAEIIFTSSGTTSSATSKHHVADLNIYKKSYLKAFEHFYGNIEDYIILGLLPSYLERDGSSLIYMVNDLIEKSNDSRSGFYLNQLDELTELLIALDTTTSKKILLIGVSFALLNLIEKHQFSLNNTIIMETGGMKGRREHWNRTQVHTYLKERWNNPKVLSEYGMTELLGQAYTRGGEIFYGNAAFKPMVRDLGDPLRTLPHGQGALNIIDLANIDSCCFIATEDLVRVEEGDAFEILGRLDHAALRGCSLMTA